MTRIVRVAVTETVNAFVDMPARLAGLDALAGRLEEVRRANVDHNVALVRAAAEAGARAVGLGELCTAPYFALEERALWFGLAEDAAAGPTVRALRALSRELGILLVAPIYELEPASGRRFNTAVLIDRGELLGRHSTTGTRTPRRTSLCSTPPSAASACRSATTATSRARPPAWPPRAPSWSSPPP